MISCKQFAQECKDEIKSSIQNDGVTATLCIVQVGDNPASNKYIKGKVKDCDEVGIATKHYKLPEEVDTETIIEVISKCNCDGVIVQLPLPKHIDKDRIMKCIPVGADVDGFKITSKFNPCTAEGIMMYLNANQIELDGKNAVVIGRSEIVGKPMADLLNEANCTVTLCHSHTKDMSVYTKNADIIIVAVGKRNMLTADMVSEDKKPIIIDVGINVDEDGKLHGDCDYVNLVDKCSLITPVPGGVGLLTRCALLKNTYQSAT